MRASRARRRVAWLLAALLLAVPLAAAAAAGASSRAGGPGRAPDASRDRPLLAVTLITGDRVAMRGVKARVELLRVTPGPGRKHIAFTEQLVNGHYRVVPLDALPLLAAGKLDPRLFDVTGLIEQGYDDARRNDLPLLVERQPGTRATGPLAGARALATMPRLGITAVSVPKRSASSFWAGVSGGGSGVGALRRGTSRIWLSARVRATLDQSVPQVGAPVAWGQGFDGRGVTVAVLDTGYDHGHPDLRRAVAASEDFTGGGDTVDRFGHGTHVSSILAGSGAASGGRYRGVAPGATLIEGKVLGDDGFGDEAGVLAGMEWAVARGARVVSMSLGGGPTDGTDPLSQAVNDLTGRFGTLFVIAAGNSGAPGTIESPGAADAALTVASVTKQDTPSYFSSRGPRDGDRALKPDIAAPGSDIVAARAPGTFPSQVVSDRYARLSGTSMATPHVAGAAAILAQRHPGWRAEQLKAELMGSAAPVAGADAYTQGSGRLDVARAIRQQVTAIPASLSMGTVPRAPAGATVERTLTYRNDGTKPVTLSLALELRDQRSERAPADLARLGAHTVTVPAGGSAKVTVVLDPAQADAGLYGGWLTAKGGATRVRTPFGAFLLQERATHTLTVRATDREGAAAFGDVIVQNERSGEAVFVFLDRDQQTVQLPEGDYRVLTQVFGVRPHSPDLLEFVDVTTMAERVQLDQDSAVDLDARRGKPVALGVDEPEARIGDGDSLAEGVGSAIPGVGFALTAVQGGIARHFAVGSGPLPGVSYLVVGAWERPKVTVKVLGPEPIELSPYDNNDKGWRGDVTAELADVGAGTPEDLAGKDLAGKVALFTSDFDVPQDELHQRIAALARSGAVLVLAEPYVDLEQATALPVLQVFSPFDIADLHAALSRGPVTVHARGTASSPYAYHLFDRVRDQVPDGYVFDHRKGSLATVRADYHATDGLDHRTGAVFFFDDGEYTGFAYTIVQPPHQRTEYYTPGVSWTGLLETGTSASFYSFISTPARYRAGEERRTTWGAAPFEPSMPQYGTDPQDGQPLPWAYRSDDQVRVRLPMLSDSSPDHRGFLPDPVFDGHADGGSTTLACDGRALGHSDVPGVAGFDLPTTTVTCRLVAEVVRDDPSWIESTRVRAAWTFRSGHVDPRSRKALPLLDARLALPLDGRNQAAAGAPLTFTVDVGRQPGSLGGPVHGVRLWASSDDGRRWTPLSVERSGGSWRATVHNPAGGFVSLRVRVFDSSGNSLDETIIRAYQIAG